MKINFWLTKILYDPYSALKFNKILWTVTIHKLVLTFRAELSCTLELRVNACFCFGNYFMSKNDELQPALNYIVNDVNNKTVFINLLQDLQIN